MLAKALVTPETVEIAGFGSGPDLRRPQCRNADVSTFALETLDLIREGSVVPAATNAAGSPICGVAAALLGAVVAPLGGA